MHPDRLRTHVECLEDRTLLSAVANRLLFYNNSQRYDTVGGPQGPLPFADDNAIARDKVAYLPNGITANFFNVSSYTRGINGLMVDISGAHGALTAGDFIFKTGNNNSPSSWNTAVPAPTTVTTRLGAGSGGSDRVELIWADNAIQKTWLEIVVKGNDALGGSNTNTGLATSDVFFWASAIADSSAGDTPTSFTTNSNDEIDARLHPATLISNISVTSIYDFDRNGMVNSNDQIAARLNPTTAVTAPKCLNIGAGGPFAPDTAAIVSALAGSASTVSGSLSSSPPAAIARVEPIERASPASSRLEQLASSDALRARATDKIADELNSNGALFDSEWLPLKLE